MQAPRSGLWLGAGLCAALILGLLPGLARLRLDVSNESYFVHDDPALTRYRDLLRRFGSDETVYVLVEVPGGGAAFDPPHLERLLSLGRELAALPRVEAVRSPLRSPLVLEREGVIEARSVQEAWAAGELVDPAQRDRWRERVCGYAPFQRLLIDAQARYVGYVVRLQGDDKSPGRRAEVARDLERVLDRAEYRDYPRAAVGTPLNATRFAGLLLRELRSALGWGVGLCALCLGLLLRSLRAVLGPLLVVGASLGGTFGAMGLLGVPLSTLSSILVTLLVCVGVADSMHVLVGYQRLAGQGAGPPEALRRALREAFVPCLITSLTTAAGFLALLSSRIAPVRHLGLFAALGCLLALACTVTLLPPLVLGWRPAPRPDERLGRLLRGLLALVLRRPRAVVAASCLGFGLLAGGIHRLRVDHDFLAYLAPDEPLRREIEFVQARLGGAVAVEVVIDTGRPGGTGEAAFLQALRAFVERAEGLDLVRASSSIHRAVAEVRPLFGEPRALPEQDDAAAQLLLMVQLLDPEAHARAVSLDGSHTRVTLRLDVAGSARYQKVLDALEAELAARFPGLPHKHLTGEAVLLARMKDYVLETQVESFLLALGVVSLLLLVLAGGWRLGALALLPNLLPVLGVLGLMGWAGIALEVSNALLATLAIGIVVDDTIHVLHRYRAAARRTGEVSAALGETLETSGRAVLSTTLVLVLTFGVYLGSALGNVREFGLLASATFLLALAGDLVLLPALLCLGGAGEARPASSSS